MRDDADHLGAEHHRHTRDVLGPGQFDHLANGHVRLDGDGIADDPALEFFDAIDLPGLIVNRHILVNDADAALLGDGNGKTGLRDGVHGGGDHGQVDAYFPRQLTGEGHVARQHFRVCRDE